VCQINRLEESIMGLLEIKGLGAHVAAAKRGIADVRTAAADLNNSTGALAMELRDVTAQVEAARKDLRFEAETLGNSAPELSEVSETSDNSGTAANAA
jgi:predicted  nucleic acid-binding Zn-ribbon protein